MNDGTSMFVLAIIIEGMMLIGISAYLIGDWLLNAIFPKQKNRRRNR